MDGELRLAGGTSTPVNGSWSGDLRTGAGVTTSSVRSAGGTRLDVELRWTAGNAYVRRTVLESGSDQGELALLVRRASEKPWARLPLDGGYAEFFMQAFDPPALLDRLRKHAGTFRIDTSARLRGAPVTHLRSTASVPLIGLWTGSTVDLYLDKNDRLVRLEVEAPDGGMSYDLTEYGKSVSVAAPPVSEITTAEEERAIELTGEYEKVRSGRFDGLSWELQRAPADDGRECWRWKATPPIAPIAADRPDGARCVVVADDAEPEDRVQFVVMSDGSTSYRALAALFPPNVRSLELGFIGGRIENVEVSTPFVWVGATTPMPAFLGVTLDDGSTIACGAGSVQQAEDLESVATSGLEQLAKSPWACLAPE